jgi:hypothetical protein
LTAVELNGDLDDTEGEYSTFNDGDSDDWGAATVGGQGYSHLTVAANALLALSTSPTLQAFLNISRPASSSTASS